MSKYFTRKFRVRWTEVNAIGHVDLSEYFRYIIETAWDWGSEIGLSISESEKLGLIWLIRETQIKFFRPLFPGEDFEMTIWLLDFRRFRGKRCFEIRLRDGGKLIAEGVQEVVILDRNSLRPAALPQDFIEKITIENPRIIEHQKFPVFPVKKESAFLLEKNIEWRDLDSQGHVNNAIYASYINEAISRIFSSFGWPPSYFKTKGLFISNQRFHIQYQSPALWGEKLAIHSYLTDLKPSGGTWYIEMERDSDGKQICQSTVDWALGNHSGDTPEVLPENLQNELKSRIAIAKDK